MKTTRILVAVLALFAVAGCSSITAPDSSGQFGSGNGQFGSGNGQFGSGN